MALITTWVMRCAIQFTQNPAGMDYKSSMKPYLPVLITFLLLPSTVWADVYKCRQPDGSTQISNSPCADGSKTIKSVNDEPVPEEVRAQAENNAERQRQRADMLQAERRADEAAERKEQERLRKEQARIDKENRLAEKNESQPTYYGGTYYRPPHVRPRPVNPVAPITPPKYGKPPDLYKVPPPSRMTR